MTMTKEEYIMAFTSAMENSLSLLEGMSDIEFNAFNHTHGDAVPEIMPMSSIAVDTDYQRPLDESRVNEAVNNFRPEGFSPISVSERDDNISYVNDGQHRLEITSRESDAFVRMNQESVLSDDMKFIMTWKSINITTVQECIGFDNKNNKAKKAPTVHQWKCRHLVYEGSPEEFENERTTFDSYYFAWRITNLFIRHGIGLGLVIPVNYEQNINEDVVLEKDVHYRYIPKQINSSPNIFYKVDMLRRNFFEQIYNKPNGVVEGIRALEITLEVIKRLPRTKGKRTTDFIFIGMLTFVYENRYSWNSEWTDEQIISDIAGAFDSITMEQLYHNAVVHTREFSNELKIETVYKHRAGANCIANQYNLHYRTDKARSVRAGHTPKKVISVSEYKKSLKDKQD